MPDFDTEYTDEIVCPHCGHEHPESYLVEFGPGMEGTIETDCAECDEEFTVSRNVTVDYTSSKLEAKP